jgi:hypothetical protein
MSSQVKILIAGAAVLLLLVGVTLALVLTAPSDDTSGEVITTAAPKSRLLYEIAPQNLKTLTVTNASGELLIERVDVDENFGFTVGEYADLPLDFERINEIAGSACALTAAEMLYENAADLSPYGLDAPQATFTAVFDDSKGTVKNVNIGNAAPDGMNYYAAFAGENAVYLINTSALDYFTEDKLDVIDKTLYRAITAASAEDTTNYKQISDLTIKRTDIPYEIELKSNPYYNQTDIPPAASTSEYVLVKPVNLDIDTKKADSVLNRIFGLTAEGIEKLRPTPEDLTAYGFDEPMTTVHFALIDKNLTLKVGNAYEDGRYVTVDGVNVIWKLSDDNLPWVTAKPLTLSIGLIYQVGIYNISTFDITGSGFDEHITRSGASSEEFAVTLNGESANADQFRLLYQEILSAQPTEIYLDPLSAAPDLSITMKGESINDNLSFYSLGDRRYAIAINGKPQFICTQTYFDSLVSNINAFISGGEVKSSV